MVSGADIPIIQYSVMRFLHNSIPILCVTLLVPLHSQSMNIISLEYREILHYIV